MNNPQKILQQYFQLDQFRPGQEAVVNSLLQGRSALAIFPTGGGKSLCYQLPALMLEGVTLVVSPLIALMKDQVDGLKKLDIAAERLDSSLSSDEVLRLYDRLSRGEIKLLYVSPERLKNERFIERLQRLQISLMAVDEAHCISEWGHNFRPDYLKLADLARTLKVERLLALTATATPAVAADIRRQFSINQQDHIQTSFRRANLRLSTTACSSQNRLSLLIERIRQLPENSSTIVYVTLQNSAEEVAAALKQQGLVAAFYHAGMKDEERSEVQNAFMNGTLNTVVATIAFGMGIDKQDIRAIFHFNLPKSIENYVQEIGRAGRDGQSSSCELFACIDDCRVLANFSYGDTPSRESLAELIGALLSTEGGKGINLGEGDKLDISPYEVSNAYDIRPLVINTLLTYLELEGIMAATGPFYTQYRLAFVESADEICKRFESEERRLFLKSLFAAGSMGRKWLSIDMTVIESELQQPKSRVLAALDYLEQKGWIETSVSGLRQGYRRLRQANPETLLETLVAMFETRECRDIERIQQVISFANHQHCLGNFLLEYFGEATTEPCGHCDRCNARFNHGGCETTERPSFPRLNASQHEIIQMLRTENHMALQQPRQLTRFLCGLPSPATTKAKLKKHRYFGVFSELSFESVLSAVSEAG
ncbi:ATP-dependent DNA helicase RecQ [Motiliproteus sp. MSK22-1]|uniref:RecQ family ATP-dependent DNA helicase n=1 Tax=Motiliproteus sp. MSK22-1 TaxID=1897630 RepID=UPI000977C3A4|nr:RecQ family ATP-dependent DNA helicase [Motiliproteus sp. MSK22-1]OMH27136.1 helicase [Motiliproteus sp. MSK22-1]